MTALATLTIADFCKNVKDPAFFDELKKNFAQVFPESTLSAQEEQAWKNSLPALAALLEGEDIDGHILIEYPMPLGNRRADCVLIGADDNGKTHLIIVELKQWSQGTIERDNNGLLTVNATEPYTTEHPCNQALVYREALNNMLDFGNQKPQMHALAYLHNYEEIDNDLLRSSPYTQSINQALLVTKKQKNDDAKELLGKLRKQSPLCDKLNHPVLHYSDTFIANFREELNCSTLFKPTDEQEKTFKKILDLLNSTQQRSCVIIKGGVGTGKTVLAMMLIHHLMQEKKNPKYQVVSAAIKDCLKSLSFWAGGNAQSNYLIVDEAHRFETHKLNGLLYKKKLIVFFIDDNQWLLPKENCRSSDIKRAARSQKMQIIEHTLTTQLRCRGANHYINWVNQFLFQKRLEKLEPDEQFEVKLVDSPRQMEDLLAQRSEGKNITSRMVAGYCWDWETRWVKKFNASMKTDITIGDWAARWNIKGKFADWNMEPGFLRDVGAIYTVQGFEHDYVGVIIGPDLVINNNGLAIRKSNQKYGPLQDFLKGTLSLPEKNRKAKEAEFSQAIRNIYYILLTRAKKGVFIYAVDPELQNALENALAPAMHVN